MSLWACQPTSNPESPQKTAGSTLQIIIQGENDEKEEIQPIEIDNCDGKGNVSRTGARSQSIDVTISAEVAATLGASVEVISAEV